MKKSRIWIRYQSKLWKEFIKTKKSQKKRIKLDRLSEKIHLKPTAEKEKRVWWIGV